MQCVILNSKISWIRHIPYVKNNVTKIIDIMFKTRTYPYCTIKRNIKRIARNIYSNVIARNSSLGPYLNIIFPF